MISTILAVVLPFLTKLPGAVGDYFKGQQEIEKLKQQAQLEIQKANIALSAELAKAELERQKEALKATGKKFKYFTFFMWFGPYMIQLVYPPLGRQIFDNMAQMPPWYAESCVAVFFTVWGISVSAPVVASVFKGMGAFFAAGREYKLEKAKVDRKVVFETLKRIFPKGFTQEQVNVIDEAIDKGEK